MAGGVQRGVQVRHDEKVSPIISAVLIIGGIGLMVAGSRKAGGGRLTVMGMLSLEPLTIGRLVYAGDGGMARVYGSSPTGQRVSFGGSPQMPWRSPD